LTECRKLFARLLCSCFGGFCLSRYFFDAVGVARPQMFSLAMPDFFTTAATTKDGARRIKPPLSPAHSICRL
jgi:hypothetical protein